MSKQDYWVTGIHAATTLLHRRPGAVIRLLLKASRSDRRLTALRQLAAHHQIPMQEVGPEQLAAIPGDTHQGVAARVSSSKALWSEQELLSLLPTLDHTPLLLVLDGITDPHNLGACLRTADAAGVDAVIIPKDRSASPGATVSRVASGAAETVTLVSVSNLARCLRALQTSKLWIVGTDAGAKTSLFEQDLRGPMALVMGAEGSGMRRLTRDCCDFLVSIPMAGQSGSLNVSVATGIALFEATRQRRGDRERA